MLRHADRIGGNQVRETKYDDQVNMMENMGLHEKDNSCDHYTWSNK